MKNLFIAFVLLVTILTLQSCEQTKNSASSKTASKVEPSTNNDSPVGFEELNFNEYHLTEMGTLGKKLRLNPGDYRCPDLYELNEDPNSICTEITKTRDSIFKFRVLNEFKVNNVAVNIKYLKHNDRVEFYCSDLRFKKIMDIESIEENHGEFLIKFKNQGIGLRGYKTDEEVKMLGFESEKFNHYLFIAKDYVEITIPDDRFRSRDNCYGYNPRGIKQCKYPIRAIYKFER